MAPQKQEEQKDEEVREELEYEKEGPPLPPLPRENDVKQLAITSFILKTTVKKGPVVAESSKEIRKQRHTEQKKGEKMRKGEEKHTSDEEKENTPLSKRTQEQDVRKMIPKELHQSHNRQYQLGDYHEIDSVQHEGNKKKSVAIRKEEVTEGQKAQQQPAKEQDQKKKSKSSVEVQIQKNLIAKTEKKRKVEEKKPDEPDKILKKKRKTELEQLEIGSTSETRTRTMEDSQEG